MCKHRDSPSRANFCRVLLSFAACTLVRPIVSTRSMSRACRMRATRSPKPALKPPQKKAELPQTAEPLMHLTAPAPTGLHCRLDGCGRPSGRGNDSGAGSFLSGSSAQVASLIASEWPGSLVLLHTTPQRERERVRVCVCVCVCVCEALSRYSRITRTGNCQKAWSCELSTQREKPSSVRPLHAGGGGRAGQEEPVL